MTEGWEKRQSARHHVLSAFENLAVAYYYLGCKDAIGNKALKALGDCREILETMLEPYVNGQEQPS